ncbi:uncharacterized protein A4U43_C02F9050 [Asparagus officinalis]|uniref:Uncharacterized protein n=2 Tax=Asparagus officinalis TaxID=4686 RepID=A0A5P1FHS7_ASPOF|nr:uncharacterized protein A4U43_C02F9050 [Asparagus officinalis]
MRSESQQIAFEILRYKETTQKPTEGIRVRLKPRSGTFNLPQIYEAEILINSQLPRRKEIVYNWKWTFYVWISLYVYIMLLIVLVCFLKPFSYQSRSSSNYQLDQPVDRQIMERGEQSTTHTDLSNALRKWRERSKRKGQYSRVQESEMNEGSTSSITGADMSEVIEDSGEFAASESSECVGG